MSLLEAADQNQKDRFGFIFDQTRKSVFIIDMNIENPEIFLKLLVTVIDQWMQKGIKQVEYQVDRKDYNTFLKTQWKNYIKDKKIIFNENNCQITTPINITFEVFIIGFFPEYVTIEK